MPRTHFAPVLDTLEPRLPLDGSIGPMMPGLGSLAAVGAVSGAIPPGSDIGAMTGPMIQLGGVGLTPTLPGSGGWYDYPIDGPAPLILMPPEFDPLDMHTIPEQLEQMRQMGGPELTPMGPAMLP